MTINHLFRFTRRLANQVIPILIYNSSCFCQLGAKNVINACQECKVKRLIYNSFADVIFDGSHHIRKGDESMPYPPKVCMHCRNFILILRVALRCGFQLTLYFDTVYRYVNGDEGSSRSSCFIF